MEAPKCPVCVQSMTVPIFQCQSGHSLCSKCTNSLSAPTCPICRQMMTQMRNWQLEALVVEVVSPCPNKAEGCIKSYTSKEMEYHLQDCIFKTMNCPLGKTIGTCTWAGKPKDLLSHFKECHSQNAINIASDIIKENVSMTVDCRDLYLFQNNKQVYILSFKIDMVQRQAYWLVQYVGSKQAAQQNIYEIHVTSSQNEKRKVMFADHCFSDSIDANDVFRQAKCAVMPLSMLAHFIKNSKLIFHCYIKRTQTEPKPSGEGKSNFNKPRSSSNTRQELHHNGPKPMKKGKQFKPTNN